MAIGRDIGASRCMGNSEDTTAVTPGEGVYTCVFCRVPGLVSAKLDLNAPCILPLSCDCIRLVGFGAMSGAGVLDFE